MAYESVKNQIDAYIKANGVNLITGPVLNAVLTTMLDELGEGYAFQGVLNTTDTPSPAADIPQAWLASAGTYIGGSITVDEGELALILHTADGWSKETVYRGLQLSHDVIVEALGYTPADETDLAEKQDTISDLSAIRSGAALGETSVQPADIENMVEAEPIGSIVPPVTPSEFATKEEVKDLDDIVNGGTEYVEEEVQYSNPGFIAVSNGAIQNTSSTWIHSDIISLADFVEAGQIMPHGSVAGVAFYNGTSFTDFISGINYPTIDNYLVDRKITKEAIASIIPENATHIAFSTDSSQYTLKVKTQNIVTSVGLVEKVTELEDKIENDIEVKIDNDIEPRLKAVEDDINGSSETIITDTPYNNGGYISYQNGQITAPTGTWIHSDFIPVRTFKSVTRIITNLNVAIAAFYSSDTFDSFIRSVNSHIDGMEPEDGVITADVLSSRVPEGAEYVVFSTNGIDGNSLVVTTEETVINSGIKTKVEALEEDVAALKERKSVSFRSLHFSFDDTISAFYDIAHNSRASIFDNAFFGALKTLNDTYGCVFSCYCFLEHFSLKWVSKLSTIANPDTTAVYFLGSADGQYAANTWYVYRDSAWTEFTDAMRDDYKIFALEDMPATYAAEFSANSDWLKFGLHGRKGMVNYQSATAEEAATDYNSFISSIVTITGTVECVDTVVRLQNFAGNLNVVRAMRDADLGVQGFLCSDYSETSGGSGGSSGGYNLASPITAAIWKKGQYYDPTERLHFYVSGLRMDNTTSANMPAYMAKFLTPSKWEQTAMIEMYCHENQMYNASNNTLTSDYVARFESVCNWAVANGFAFGYQMDKIRMAF